MSRPFCSNVLAALTMIGDSQVPALPIGYQTSHDVAKKLEKMVIAAGERIELTRKRKRMAVFFS